VTYDNFFAIIFAKVINNLGNWQSEPPLKAPFWDHSTSGSIRRDAEPANVRSSGSDTTSMRSSPGKSPSRSLQPTIFLAGSLSVLVLLQPLQNSCANHTPLRYSLEIPSNVLLVELFSRPLLNQQNLEIDQVPGSYCLVLRLGYLGSDYATFNLSKG